ncbi:DUF397 domain-containing protein [Saccharopolyspora gloriosae]|uniref:DUF397 domain-containing protein n=1 Tax=Saccharopolyspora gloriosae TaxID=455344 RepID=A0A840NC36_9PSEU|nr:DUF397 domain-containing protein [Saccharopolyspora gloriosae]MBB5068481.1 hypothetical protein [Saccharopolyspora gloriosae]
MAALDPSTLRWRRSSRSANYTNCVESAHLDWRKSSRSTNYTNCVEVAHTGHAVAARNSKAPDGGVLLVSADSWSSFLGGVRAGRFEVRS